jgi:hypothetical protein
VFNAWYNHKTDDIVGLADDLVGRLCVIVAAMQVKFTKSRK